MGKQTKEARENKIESSETTFAVRQFGIEKMEQKNCNNRLAKDLVDFTASMASNQEFSKENLALFVSPLFVDSMKILMDKNIATTSCGSGKERGILPGITGLYEKLSSENKELLRDNRISETEWRIGVPITDRTTFGEFNDEMVSFVGKLRQQ